MDQSLTDGSRDVTDSSLKPLSRRGFAMIKHRDMSQFKSICKKGGIVSGRNRRKRMRYLIEDDSKYEPGPPFTLEEAIEALVRFQDSVATRCSLEGIGSK